MITLFILSLFAAALILAAVPVVAYALMLETVAQRQGVQPQAAMLCDDSDEEAPMSFRLIGMV